MDVSALLALLAVMGHQSVEGRYCFYPKPIGFWPFTGDTLLADVSGNGNNAAGNDVSLTTGPYYLKTTGYRFSGRITSYMNITCTSTLDIGLGSWTFGAFIKDNADTNKGGTLLHWKPDSGNGLQIRLAPDSSSSNREVLSVVLRERDGESDYRHAFIGISLHTHNYESIRFDAKTPRICLSAPPSTCYPIRNTQLITNVPNIRVGSKDSANGYFVGDIFCLMLFNVSLPERDVNRMRDYCKDIYRVRWSKPDVIHYELFEMKARDRTIASSAVTVTKPAIESGIECVRSCLAVKPSSHLYCITVAYSEATKECSLSGHAYSAGPTFPALPGSVVYSVQPRGYGASDCP
ncbi:uncharacterized protein LOC135485126 [Lineus longissimus]|uniref:uncharacterized protein LOC135485126 n=1 Tax=Lineus longissimus TaxID=88925 RepID=UPI00315D037A